MQKSIIKMPGQPFGKSEVITLEEKLFLLK